MSLYQFDMAARRGFDARRNKAASSTALHDYELPKHVTVFRRDECPVSPRIQYSSIPARSNGKASPAGDRAPKLVRQQTPIAAVAPVVVEAKVPVATVQEEKVATPVVVAAVQIPEPQPELMPNVDDIRAFRTLVRSLPSTVFAHPKAGFSQSDLLGDLSYTPVSVLEEMRGHLHRVHGLVIEEEFRREAAAAQRKREALAAEAERVSCEAEAARLREDERLMRNAAALKKEREQLIDKLYRADVAVLAQLWPHYAHARGYIVGWVQTADLEAVRKAARDLSQETVKHAAAKVRAAAATRTAEVEALNPKKKGFDLLKYLKEKSAQPLAPVGPAPSKEELAALDLRVNGGRLKVEEAVYTADPNRTLAERILALDPTKVSAMHAQKPVPHTWPNIERLLNAVQGAKTKNAEGRVIGDSSVICRIQTFVAWCERN